MKTEQSLMQQVCPMLLSAGREPSPALEKQQKSMADHSMFQAIQAGSLEGEPP